MAAASLDAAVTADTSTSSTMIYVFVFAHPDDESMFFLPTIRSLIDGGKTVWLLCLTTGNYDRLGKIREKEMTEVGKMLGISKVIIRDNNDNMQDHPTERWDKTVVATAIKDSLDQPEQNHDNQFVLITFDALGISGHVNHIDTYYGVCHLMKEQHEQKEQYLKSKSATAVETKGKRLPRLRQSHSDNEGLPEKEATAEDAVEKTAETAKVVQDNKTRFMISQLDTIRTQPKTRPVQTYSKKPVPRYTQKQDS